MNDINYVPVCGIYCGNCGYLNKDCRGCGYEEGKTFWTNMMPSKICPLYDCCRNTRNLEHCGLCDDFPCKNLKHLDKRYRTKYSMSMIENLENIKKPGIEEFLRNEKIRWTCTECGGTICVHKSYCYNCGRKIWIANVVSGIFKFYKLYLPNISVHISSRPQ